MKNKRTSKNQDYIGPFDGDDNHWMTRKSTDKGGNLKEKLVPHDSNPNEAGDFHEGFSRSKMNKRNKEKNATNIGDKSAKNKSSKGFLKHTIKGKQ